MNQGSKQNGQNERPQQPALVLADHVIDQEFRGIGEDEAGELVDEHQHKAEGEQSAARTHELPDFGPNGLQALDLLGFGVFFGWRSQSLL